MNHQEKARKIIINHLEIHGSDLLEHIDITPRMVLYWWKLLNVAIFDGTLIPPRKIRCSNFRDESYGYVVPYWIGWPDIELGIKRRLEDRNLFLNVLSHEMVHQFQWETSGQTCHSDLFLRWKPILKDRVMLNLQITY